VAPAAAWVKTLARLSAVGHLRAEFVSGACVILGSREPQSWSPRVVIQAIFASIA
jgi:hypothetical protein